MKTETLNLDYGQSFPPHEYDFYRESCPEAVHIVRGVVENLYYVRSDVTPALPRLLFHDCFVQVIISCFVLLISIWVSHFLYVKCLLIYFTLVLFWVLVASIYIPTVLTVISSIVLYEVLVLVIFADFDLHCL